MVHGTDRYAACSVDDRHGDHGPTDREEHVTWCRHREHRLPPAPLHTVHGGHHVVHCGHDEIAQRPKTAGECLTDRNAGRPDGDLAPQGADGELREARHVGPRFLACLVGQLHTKQRPVGFPAKVRNRSAGRLRAIERVEQEAPHGRDARGSVL